MNGRRDFLLGTLAATGSLRAQSGARKTVYAWYPARFGSWETSSLRWDLLTHICFRSVVLRGDGTLELSAGSPPRNFVAEAHRQGVKVCILAWSKNRQDTDSYLARHGREAARNLLTFVRENELDGVTYDDEMIQKENSVTGGANRPLVTAFFDNLSQIFKTANSDYHIAYAAPPVISPADRFAADWLDWPAIAKSLDAIIPMLYDANPPSIGWTTSPEPMAGSKETGRTAARDVTSLIGAYYHALGNQKSKLLLGITAFPWPGYEFRSPSDTPLAPTAGPGKGQSFEYLEGEARIHGKRWDSKLQAAWYVYPDAGQFKQGWYDDERSWSAKLDYVKREGLGGVGIWVLNGKTDSPKMWDMLRVAFGG